MIKKYRIKKASQLLKNTEGNISEIMYKVGFSKLSCFARCFKAAFGLSPKEYQQRENKMRDVRVKVHGRQSTVHGRRLKFKV